MNMVKREALVAATCVALLSISFFIRLLDNGFISDDFTILGVLIRPEDQLGVLFELDSDHFMPVLRAALLAQFWLFGPEPAGFYAVNVLVHSSVAALLVLVVAAQGASTTVAFAAGLLFAFSGAHWRTPMWITTQGQMLSALLLLLSFLCLHAYLQKGRLICIIAALGLHFVALLSFTVGPEVPLCFLLFTVYVSLQGGETYRRAVARGIAVGSLFLLPLVAYGVLRWLLVSVETVELSNFTEGYHSIDRRVRTALIAISYGGLLRFAASFTGAILLDEERRKVVAVVAGTLLIWLVAMVPWKQERVRRVMWLLLAASLIALAFYGLPAFARAERTFRYFIVRSRYCYLPNLILIPAFLGLLWGIAQSTYFTSDRWKRALIGGFYTVVLLTNLSYLAAKEQFLEREAAVMKEITTRYLSDLESLLLVGTQLAIEDTKFNGPKSYVAGWNVTTEQVCRMYLGERCAQVCFSENCAAGISEGEARYYHLDKASGELGLPGIQ